MVDTDVDALLGGAIPKDRALHALEARQEIAKRMLRHRRLAMETACAADASWAEIDTALGVSSGIAQAGNEATLARQKQDGLAPQERHDPGTLLTPGL